VSTTEHVARADIGLLYLEQRPRLLGRLRGKWRISGDLAEDLLHDAWVKAIEHMDRFDSSRPFEPWVLRILDNVVIDHLRTTRTASGEARQLVVDVTDHHQPLNPPRRHHDDRLADRETLTNAMARLPARQQQTAVGVLVDGLTLDEAAEHMKLSNTACRQLLHRARVGLRRALLDQGVLPGFAAPLVWWRRRWSAFAARLWGLEPSTLAGSTASAAVAAVFAVTVTVAASAAATAHAIQRSTPAVGVDAVVTARWVPAQPARPARMVQQAVRPDATTQLPRRSAAAEPTTHTGDRQLPPRTTVGRPAPVGLPAGPIGVAGHRIHQQAPTNPRYDYGLAIEAPGGSSVRAGVVVERSESTAVDATACSVADGAPLMYCDGSP
jgi:RNA polymerase sigma-70 factor (ECF subfamily)